MVCVSWCHVPPSYATDILPASYTGRTKVEECSFHRLSFFTFAKCVLYLRCQNAVGEPILPLLCYCTIAGILHVAQHAAMTRLLHSFWPLLPTYFGSMCRLRDGYTSHNFAQAQRVNRTTVHPKARRIDIHPNACSRTARVSSRMLACQESEEHYAKCTKNRSIYFLHNTCLP